MRLQERVLRLPKRAPFDDLSPYSTRTLTQSIAHVLRDGGQRDSCSVDHELASDRLWPEKPSRLLLGERFASPYDAYLLPNKWFSHPLLAHSDFDLDFRVSIEQRHWARGSLNHHPQPRAIAPVPLQLHFILLDWTVSRRNWAILHGQTIQVHAQRPVWILIRWSKHR